MAEVYNALPSNPDKESTEFTQALSVFYPMLGYVLVQSMRSDNVSPDDTDDLLSAGGVALYQFLEQQWVDKPANSVRLYKALRTTIRRVYIKVLTRSLRPLPNAQDDHRRAVDPTYGYVTTDAGVYSRLYEDDLVDHLIRRCKSHLRFTGLEAGACGYILARMHRDEYISSELLSNKYKLSPRRRSFFVSYCTALYRRVLYDVRDQLGYRTRRRMRPVRVAHGPTLPPDENTSESTL